MARDLVPTGVAERLVVARDALALAADDLDGAGLLLGRVRAVGGQDGLGADRPWGEDEEEAEREGQDLSPAAGPAGPAAASQYDLWFRRFWTFAGLEKYRW